MSRAFDADCVGHVVKVEGKPVISTILSQGTKASAGVGILQGSKMFYVASNASDIKDLITSMGAILDQISVILAGLDAVSTSPGSVTAAIAALAVLKVQFAFTKENLK